MQARNNPASEKPIGVRYRNFFFSFVDFAVSAGLVLQGFFN